MTLLAQRHGKSRVRVMRVDRKGPRHALPTGPFARDRRAILDRYPHVTRVTIDVTSTAWSRMRRGNEPGVSGRVAPSGEPGAAPR